MNPRTGPSSVLAHTTKTSAIGELVILLVERIHYKMATSILC